MATMPPSRVNKRVPKGRVYESEAPMQQQHFPRRRKIVRANCNPLHNTRRRDAGKATKTASQQTLTQIDFIHTTPSANDDYGDGIERQGQTEVEFGECRPAKRRRKTNPRRIPKLAGQDTLTQLDFVKLSRPRADTTDYNVWLETSVGETKPDEEHGVKEEFPSDNDRSPPRTASPTNASAKRHDMPAKTRTLRKNGRRKGESTLPSITVPKCTSLNSDAAPRSPLSDLSPNKPPSKTSPMKYQNKKTKRDSHDSRTTTIRKSPNLTPPQIIKRKQILAIANSDSEDTDEGSDNDENHLSKNSTVIIKVQKYRPYPANEHSGPEAENRAHKSQSPSPSSLPTSPTSNMPPVRATFSPEEILDSEPARAASSQAGDIVKLEESSPPTYQTNSIANTISETTEARTHTEVPPNEQGRNLDSNENDSLSVSFTRDSPTTRKKRPHRQDAEQSYSILPTPLSQATTVDPDTPNASSSLPARSVRSMQSIHSTQLLPSSLRQESSLDQQYQEKQQQRHEPEPHRLTEASNILNNETNVNDENTRGPDNGAGESHIYSSSDWNATCDLDGEGICGHDSYSLPSSPVEVVTAENLLPESLMAFSIPAPPSYSRML